MSIIIGYTTKDSVYMAGDRIMLRGDEVSYARKVLNKGKYLIGFVGCRDLYVNADRCPPPEYIPEEHGTFNNFVNTKLYEWGNSGVLKGLSAGGIIGYLPPNGLPELVEIDYESDKRWHCIECCERLDENEDNFLALGSGSSYAIGAIEAYMEMGSLTPDVMLDKAIRITCKRHNNARPDSKGRIDIVSITR